MKIMYTLGNFIYSGHQVLFYTINSENESTQAYQQEADKCFATSFAPMQQMFKPLDELEGMDAEPPMPGDIIWTHTSGNQHIASGVWQLKSNGPIDFNALRQISKSVYTKAQSLDQKYVSMPLLTEDLSLWNFIYPIIEGEFGEDVQIIVHIPLEATLLNVLDNIGGEINAFESKQPIIRFSQSDD